MLGGRAGMWLRVTAPGPVLGRCPHQLALVRALGSSKNVLTLTLH